MGQCSRSMKGTESSTFLDLKSISLSYWIKERKEGMKKTVMRGRRVGTAQTKAWARNN